MRQKTERHQDAAERTIKDIRRQTRKRYSSEEKIRIVLAGLRGENSIAELCRQEGIAQGLYYSWSKEFFEAGKKRLAAINCNRPASVVPIGDESNWERRQPGVWSLAQQSG